MKNKEINSTKKGIIIAVIMVIGVIVGTVINICINNSLLYFPIAYDNPDYTVTVNILNNVYSDVSSGRGYFPLTYVILNIIVGILGKGINGFYISFAIFMCVLFYFCIKLLKNVKYRVPITFSMLMFSYPLIFEIERTNIEYLVVLFLIMFFTAYIKGRYKLAAILLAIPICMKLYPAVFIILFLKDKKYKEFILCGIFSIFFMVESYMLIGGNFKNLHTALENFSFFTELFAKNGNGIPFCHTLWILAHYINLQFGTLPINVFAENYITIYTFIIMIIAILLVLYILFIEKEQWKIITILTIMMITFPHVSFDYTLIHMYIPILFFIISKNMKNWEAILFSILFAISIIPMNWFQKSVNEVVTLNLGLILRPVILMSIIIIIVATTIKNRKKLLLEGKIVE